MPQVGQDLQDDQRLRPRQARQPAGKLGEQGCQRFGKLDGRGADHRQVGLAVGEWPRQFDVRLVEGPVGGNLVQSSG